MTYFYGQVTYGCRMTRFEQLRAFLATEIRTSHVYQPVVHASIDGFNLPVLQAYFLGQNVCIPYNKIHDSRIGCISEINL